VTVTLDGRGEYDSAVIWSLNGNGDLRRERTEPVRNSLEFFYGVVTDYLGYRVRNGAGKVMGLAPYGAENSNLRERLYEMVELTDDGYDVSELAELKAESGYAEAVNHFERVMGYPRRLAGEEFDQGHKDVAYLAQRFLKEAVINVVEDAIARTGERKICLSGGIALNCKMNKRVRKLESVEDIFIQPVAGDSGLSLGAVLEHSTELGYRMRDPYLGPDYSNGEVVDMLEKVKFDSEEVENPGRVAAEKIADGKLVGWFQGRLEMGLRALGHRSILADPRDVESKDRVNFYVKHRENWRPFAPSILEEYAPEYFENYTPSPFMIDTFDPVEEKKDEMRAVLHPADDTTRPHTVEEEVAPEYYRLIDEFRKITGVPLVLNTSFNDSGEPMVNTLREAVKDFFGMGLDYLVVGNRVIGKGVTASAVAERLQPILYHFLFDLVVEFRFLGDDLLALGVLRDEPRHVRHLGDPRPRGVSVAADRNRPHSVADERAVVGGDDALAGERLEEFGGGVDGYLDILAVRSSNFLLVKVAVPVVSPLQYLPDVRFLVVGVESPMVDGLPRRPEKGVVGLHEVDYQALVGELLVGLFGPLDSRLR
jgi:carbamoyltransferase